MSSSAATSSSLRISAATTAAALGLAVTTLLGLQLTGAHTTTRPMADAAPTATATPTVQPDSLLWG